MVKPCRLQETPAVSRIPQTGKSVDRSSPTDTANLTPKAAFQPLALDLARALEFDWQFALHGGRCAGDFSEAFQGHMKPARLILAVLITGRSGQSVSDREIARLLRLMAC